MKKRKNIIGIVLMIMLLTLAVGCSSEEPVTEAEGSGDNVETPESSEELDSMTVQLKWLPQSQFMGFYVAQANGYYEEEGIDIQILPGGSDIIPEQQVYSGVADVGVTWVSSLMKYQSEGWDLVHSGQLFQNSAMLLVSKESTGIESALDLEGKKVGSWFGGNEYEIYALLAANGLDRNNDLELVQQDYTMNQLINDTIDAASAMTYNELGLLYQEIDPSEVNILDMNDEGVAMLQDCLFVSSDWIAENEDLYVRFLRATIKGWADAAADPEAAGTIVYNVDQSVSLEHQIYMAEEVAKLVVTEGFDPANIGYTDMDAYQQTADLALEHGLLTQPVEISETTIQTKYWEAATRN
ncbi:NitT/TauT family transport system substrate-binding protein [Natranaerovirga hydrolytica]|uniref:Thiamine pyrimidine synthase n=1 Tax=Natranaerovirga hydrolytica TaxID=680378 RepID=A0A4R1MKY1_9FIRM|nr:ABC transporter substrate-binding protein [Natranaerovirga hydrolytica]TCK93227.1 NitT/TauT family transport system substrate-binding protein [Natranaerovirga hydrolytica]